MSDQTPPAQESGMPISASKQPSRYRRLYNNLQSFFFTIYAPILTAAAAITILALVCFIFFQPDFAVLSVLGLCGSGIMALAYKLLLPSPAQPRPIDKNTSDIMLAAGNGEDAHQTHSVRPTTAILIHRTKLDAQSNLESDDPGKKRLLRYAIAAISLTLSVFSVTLILSHYGLVADFLLIFPFTAFFPFSYLAYAVFQREVRIKRLRLDFALLGIEFPDELVQQVQGFGYFALHITLAMLFTIVGLSLFGAQPQPGFDTVLGLIQIPDGARTAMQYGFLGSYLFAIQLIYRRYTTYDLHPTVYMYAALTILAGLVFNYVAFQALSYIAANNGQPHQLGSPFEAILAFGLGFFPLLAVQWFYNIVTKTFSVRTQRSDDLPLGLLDGISTMHEIRLRDFGIDNIQNLAAADLSSLLLNTPFNAQLVVDWVDQAILYLYLEQSEITSFRQAQVRTVSDFREMWKPMYDRVTPQQMVEHPPREAAKDIDTLRKDKANQLIANTPPEYLDLLYEATNFGPNLHFVVHYWQNADRQRKINYLFNILPERNSPKYAFALGQAFIEYAGRDLTQLTTQESQAIMGKLNEVWADIEKFPIDIEQTMTLNTSLGWAGLGFLRRYSASQDNLHDRITNLHKAEEAYQKAEALLKPFAEQIAASRKILVEEEARIVKTVFEKIRRKLREANEESDPHKQIEYKREACEYLKTYESYLPAVIALIEGAISNGASKPVALEQLKTLQAALTAINFDATKLDGQFVPENGWGWLMEAVDGQTVTR